MENVLCGYCKRELDTSMELEKSDWLCEIYCNSDCATSRYFEEMLSGIVDTSDNSFFNEKKIKIVDGKLYLKDDVDTKEGV